MRTARSLSTAVVSAVVTVVTALAVAGCTSESDPETASGAEAVATQEASEAEATSSATPEATPADPKQTVTEQRTADATERYEEYSRIQDVHAQQGESAYPELSRNGYLGSHDIREYIKNFGSDIEGRGQKQTGSVVVESVKFVEYDGDSSVKNFSGHEIQLTACLDLSGIDYVDASGKSVLTDKPGRLLMDVTMIGTEISIGDEPTAVWAISSDAPTEKEC